MLHGFFKQDPFALEVVLFEKEKGLAAATGQAREVTLRVAPTAPTLTKALTDLVLAWDGGDDLKRPPGMLAMHPLEDKKEEGNPWVDTIDYDADGTPKVTGQGATHEPRAAGTPSDE